MTQGDNLDDAKAFSGLCDVTLSRLVESESYIVTRGDENVYVLSALDTIQNEAKRMQARAISRAAMTAIEGVETLKDTKCQVRNLRDLMHLVRQYQSGVEELTTASTQVEAAPDVDSAAAEQDEHATFEAARTTLKSVIRHAGAQEDIAALSRLVQWRPDTLNDMTFNQLMPALTDEILRAGRTFNKSVSVSYAADDDILDPNLYHELGDSVAKVATWLVEHVVKSPEQRLGQGLGQSAHIAVTARRVENRLNVLMSCDGDLSQGDTVSLPEMSNLSAFGGQLSCETTPDIVRIEITGLKLETPGVDTGRVARRETQKPAEQIA